jgi:hypothetical protein
MKGRGQGRDGRAEREENKKRQEEMEYIRKTREE